MTSPALSWLKAKVNVIPTSIRGLWYRISWPPRPSHVGITDCSKVCGVHQPKILMCRIYQETNTYLARALTWQHCLSLSYHKFLYLTNTVICWQCKICWCVPLINIIHVPRLGPWSIVWGVGVGVEFCFGNRRYYFQKPQGYEVLKHFYINY